MSAVRDGELETPVLLLAMPQVVDPFFRKSVVLLIHHQPQGSLGFIVNRPYGIQISEILEGLDIAPPEQAAEAFFGGPVQPHLGTVIYRKTAEDPLDGEPRAEVYPGIAMTQQISDLNHLLRRSPSSYRLFLGYAGWGSGQLVQEILRNDWLTAPVREDLIFADNCETVWDQALASVGIDPAQLPAWTSAGDDEEAN